MQIIPSILDSKAENYANQISRLSPYLNHFQIDIADGILVPNKTAQLKDIISHISLYPPSSTLHLLSFDFHLMTVHPEQQIEHLRASKAKINIDTVFIHYKSLSPDVPFDRLVNKYSPVAQIGLVLNPEDEVNTINSTIPVQKIPIIQIMTVYPGMQGTPFIAESLNKIGQLRFLGYRNKIAVDGGINEKTLQLMIFQNQIPDIICPGSYFSKAENLKERVEEMKRVISLLRNKIPQ